MSDDLSCIRQAMDLDDLPQGVIINTMTLTYCFDTDFNIDNIGKYITLSEKGIKTIKFIETNEDINQLCLRSWDTPVINKTPHKSNAFLNQASIELFIDNANLNVKIFNNGSMQMTGCKGVDNFIKAIKIICEELRKIKGIMNKDTYKLELKPFIVNREQVMPRKLKDLNIRMIQTSFLVGMPIDRDKLCKLLNKKNIHATFDPDTHPGVNIRFKYSQTKVLSIFVFESSSVILTGVNTKDHIIKAYNFIIYIILSNYKEIMLIDINKLIEQNILELD